MTNNIDDLTDNLNHNDWKSLLAWAQIIQKRAKTLETQAKKHLETELNPSDPENAMIGDQIAAEISITRGTSKPKLVIKDSTAYTEFLRAHGHEDGIETVEQPKTFTADQSFIDDLTAENGGELPDGVDFGRVAAPTVRVTLTRGIVDEPLPLSPALSGLLQLTAPTSPSTDTETTTEEVPSWL